MVPGRARRGDQAIPRDRARPRSTAFVTFRDRKGNFHNHLTCSKEGQRRRPVRDRVRRRQLQAQARECQLDAAHQQRLRAGGRLRRRGGGAEDDPLQPGQGRQGVPARDQDDRGLPRRGAEDQPDPGRQAAARALQGGRGVLLRPRLRRRPPRQPSAAAGGVAARRAARSGRREGPRRRLQMVVVQREAQRVADAQERRQGHRHALLLLPGGRQLGMPRAIR